MNIGVKIVNWINYDFYIEIIPPREFCYEQCLAFLGRSELEILHQIKDKNLFKAINVGSESVLIKISYLPHKLRIDFVGKVVSFSHRERIASYIWEMFDFNQNLGVFYSLASYDLILQSITQKYYGLRIIGIPDLFEAVTWAIIGQQINLKFAYLLKRRFVEKYGDKISFDGTDFWLYPTFRKVASLEIEDLRKLQFSTQKASYIIGFAKAMNDGEISKEGLLNDPKVIKEALLKVKGIGDWTAEYVMMKCFQIPSAFPIADVGLHQALQKRLGSNRKPTIEEIKEIAKNWDGWEAYATFYLWRSLYD